MIFFLYGQDDYRMLARKQGLLSELKKKYPDLVVEKFSAENAEGLAGFRDFTEGQSLFSEKKVAILDNAEELDPKKAEGFFGPLTERKDVALIAFFFGKPTKPFSFLLQKPVLAEEFNFLSDKEAENFIKKMAKEEGVEIPAPAATLLANLYFKNTWGLVTELQKLFSLGKKSISLQDVEGLGLELVMDYWPLVNALKSPALKTRLWALKKLSGQKEQSVKTFNIYSALAKNRSEEFAKYDVLIKSGKLDYEEALLSLAIG